MTFISAKILRAMLRLKQKPGENTDYGSTGCPAEEEGSSHSTQSSNTIFRWSCTGCTVEQVQLHCAAISGIIPEYGNTVCPHSVGPVNAMRD